MKGILASSLGMTLGLLASTGRADDFIWRPVREAPSPNAVVPASASIPTPTAPIMPAAVSVGRPIGVAPSDNETVSWVRTRAQVGEELPTVPAPFPVGVQSQPGPVGSMLPVAPTPGNPPVVAGP